MSNQYTLADDKLVVFVAGEKYTFSVAGLSEMEMRKSKRNRALTLIAMIILELEFAHGGPTPTQEAILNKVIDLGGTLSPTSVSMINRNIQALIDDEYVMLRADNDRPKRGRGGPAWPWYTRYAGRVLRQSLSAA